MRINLCYVIEFHERGEAKSADDFVIMSRGIDGIVQLVQKKSQRSSLLWLVHFLSKIGHAILGRLRIIDYSLLN